MPMKYSGTREARAYDSMSSYGIREVVSSPSVMMISALRPWTLRKR